MLKRLASFGVVVSLSALSMAASLEKLGQPCRAFNVLSGRVVTDPAGHEWLAMMNMNETSGAELLLIDFAANQGKVFRAPAGQGAWALTEVPGKQLIAGTFYDGSFMSFDLATMAWGKSARAGKEEYIWTAAIGSDGRVYGGTYPNGHLAAVDPKTFEVEDIPRPAEAAPNQYLRQTSATPDGRILCQWSTQKMVAMLYDPKTKAFAAVPKSLEGIQTGLTWNGYFVSGNNWDGPAAKGVKAFKGEAFEEVDPLPFPTPAGKESWHVETYASTAEVLFIRQGNALYRFKAGEKELTKLTGDGLAGGRLLGQSAGGTVLGLRGQDYVVLKAGIEQAELRPIPVTGGPRSTHFLRADDEGRVWGGPTFGQTVFYMDAKTGKAVNTSQVCNAGGEVYDAAFVDGKTYLVAYSGGDIIEFDPRQPWDQAGGKNPRVIAHLHDMGAGYIRPNAGVSVGVDGKLYAGWLAVYGTYGGAVSVTEPATGKTEIIENPLGKQGVCGVAFDGKMIYVGTTLAGNGLPNQKGGAKFGVVEPGTKRVLFERTFEGAGTVDHLVWDERTNKVAFAVANEWYVYEPASKIVTKLEVPRVQSRMQPGLRERRVYYGSETSVMVLDLATGKAEKVVDTPGKVEAVAVNKAGELYVSCGVDVYRVKE